MNVMTHLLESDLYNESDFYWSHYSATLFLLHGAHAISKDSMETCDNCNDISDLLTEHFEVMAEAEEAYGKAEHKPPEEITLDALRDRLSLGQRVVIYDKETLEKLNFRIVEEVPKKEAAAKIGKPRKAA
jgi:FKBP-type peptidyl-prolyl cis-trans isomerase 2